MSQSGVTSSQVHRHRRHAKLKASTTIRTDAQCIKSKQRSTGKNYTFPGRMTSRQQTHTDEMSRMSIGSFLSKAKYALSKSIRSKGEHPASFVIGNQSADLDSITCALVYGYLQSSKPEARKAERFIVPITNIPSSELKLRPELTALLKHADLKPSDLLTLDDLGKLHESLPPEKTDWTLVDHNVFLGDLGEHYADRVVGVIDHHDDEGQVPKDAEPRIIENTGSCNSLVVNYSRKVWESISSAKSNTTKMDDDSSTGSDPRLTDAQLAKLALGSILIDTVNFKAEKKVTEHDRKAVSYLEDKIEASPDPGKSFDRDAFFNEIDDAKSDLDGLTLEEILRKDYKQWDEKTLTLGISSAVRSVEYLRSKAKDEKNFVSELLDFAKDRNLDLYAAMSAHNEKGSFQRQLVLMAVKDGKAVEVAEKFVDDDANELKLEKADADLNDSAAGWLRFWVQGNLEASRKRVAPMLRDAMEGRSEGPNANL